jgi:deoxyribonuclease-4
VTTRVGVEGPDELGAHVSAAGGVETAPGRAHDLGAAVLQLFTKQAQRWLEPELGAERVAAYRAEREARGIRVAAAHDSYLINLASPDPPLRARSLECFVGELRRSSALGLDYVVTHPGNATDRDVASGIARNAEAIALALEAVPDPIQVLLELTAGAGSCLGGTFEELAAILDAVPEPQRARMGVCVDSCHAYVGAYDLVDDFDGVWRAFDDILGMDRLRLLHLNDSKSAKGSRWDRHQHIGEASLGLEPFRRLMTEDRFRAIPKLLETPKEPDPLVADRRNLATLRRLRSEGLGHPAPRRRRARARKS